MSKFAEFENNLKRYYVFNIKYKNTSKFMKLLGFILFFNKEFMTHYITTIGNTVYFPDENFIKENNDGAARVLAHEIVHVAQKEKYGMIPYTLMYLFPQCLALFAFLAILAFVWLPFLWCLLFLIFLAPIPAPWRKKFELEGYTMSLYMLDLRLRELRYPDEMILKEMSVYAVKINVRNFKGPGYWYMWPFGVQDDFGKKIEDIRSGVISDTSEIYGRMKRAYLNTV